MLRPLAPLWSARPALTLAVCFGAGIGAAEASGGTFGGWLAAAGVCAALVPALWRRPAGAGLLALGLAFAMGGARLALDRTAPPGGVGELAPAMGSSAPLLLEGALLTAPVRTAGGLRFRLEARRAARGPAEAAVRGAVEAHVWAPGLDLPDLRLGDVVQVAGRLERPPRRMNPADFDYARHLRRNGVYALLRVDSAGAVYRVRRAAGPLAALAGAGRAYASGRLGRYIHDPERREVVRALVLGDRSAMSDEMKDHFARTGLTHILAVSGLHLVVVGFALYGLLGGLFARCGIGWRVSIPLRAALTALALAVYTLLTGASASVLRAAVMGGVLLAGDVCQRAHHVLNALGVAALLLLAWSPGLLYDVGFQLSFAAVAAIVLIQPVLAPPASWRRRPVLKAASGAAGVTIAASIGTFPVLLYHFGQASFAGVLLNMWAVPASTAALVAGLATAATGGWAPPLGAAYGAAAEALIWILMETARLGDRWLAFANVAYPADRAPVILALAALAGMAAAWPRPRLRWAAALAALGLLCLDVWAGALRTPALEAEFFRLTHGDAALIELPTGERLLVDAGKRTPYGSDARRVLLPHLRRRGVRRLTALVLTHLHDDHAGGAPDLLRAMPVGRVILRPGEGGGALEAEIRRICDSLGVPVHTPVAGDTLAIHPSLPVRVLWPPAGPPPAPGENNRSLVLHLTYGRTSFLLLGDAEAPVEAALVRAGLPPAHVVKVGHHGSRTSSTPALTAAAAPPDGAPAYAVVSTSQVQGRPIPSAAAVAAWRRSGFRVLETGREGMVWLRADGFGVRRVAWR